MQLNADTILKMNFRDASALFPGDDRSVRKGFAKLAAKWHPDVCNDPQAEDVFSHILSLRGRVSEKKSQPANQKVFKTMDGKALATRPLSERKVDQGEIVVGRRALSTHFDSNFADLGAREAQAPTLFRFGDDAMKNQMRPFLPKPLKSLEIQGGGKLVIVEKSETEILMADLLDKEARVPDVHAAWICSGLMNICAWMEYSGLVHGAVAPEHILIDPEKHSVRLAAGWTFATPVGERPVALPARTLALIPRMAVKGQPATCSIDLEMTRQTVREALGDPRGTGGGVSALPGVLKAWIDMPPAATAAQDYANWQSALQSAWGKRRFVDYPLRAQDIYSS